MMMTLPYDCHPLSRIIPFIFILSLYFGTCNARHILIVTLGSHHPLYIDDNLPNVSK